MKKHTLFVSVAAVVTTLTLFLLGRGLWQNRSSTSSQEAASPASSSPLVGKSAPSLHATWLADVSGISVKGRAGEAVSIEDFREHVLILNFWASWCESCRGEAALLERVWKTQTPPVLVLGLSLQDETQASLDAAHSWGKTYPIAMDSKSGKTSLEYGVSGVPETFFITADGIVAHKHVGPLTERDLKLGIARATESKPRISSQGHFSKPERGNRRISDFSAAKKLARQVYRDHRETFYCGCPYDPSGVVQPRPCGFEPSEGFEERSHKIEWEHVVPAQALGKDIPEWEQGHLECVHSKGKKQGRSYKGRACAEKISETFRHRTADLYNLVPAIGSVNAMRGHAAFGETATTSKPLGACSVSLVNGIFQPRPDVRGDIARIYFYMDQSYPEARILEDPRQRELFEDWAERDPVDAWERERGQRIARLQGNENPFLKGPPGV